MEKKFSFYLTFQTAERLEEMQKRILEKEGRVTKAYIVNTAINEYYEKHFKKDNEES
ncbi:hypothetical protein P8797_07435 [Bacillus subtilis]|uniref:hypothetical protein n=1 Tax=Bacillus TaxID=1386 RepID=UPI000AFA9701|nr:MULTISPECIES: hypothetical protein [Bacillus]MEC0312933.1 hypothetical protein [Bacillus subtilis]MEC0361343.1 hypothetical protein [Bacillus subtilis]